MDRQEAAKVIFLLSTNYKNFPEQDKVEAMTLLWSTVLQDIPYKLVETAAVTHMMNSKFPPTIHDIMEQLNTITKEPELTADEAWGTFLKAVSSYGYYRKKEALESLTDDVRSIVEAMGYEYLCQSTNQMADRSHFLKSYNARMERKKTESLMPSKIKHRIETARVEMIE